MLSSKDIKSKYPAKVAYDEHNIILANLALDFLWEERCKERGETYTGDRSGSCKFAALLARSLFGGRLAGNHEHVFTVNDSEIVDLNFMQKDVISLKNLAHARTDFVLCDREYRSAFNSCLPRVQRWEEWFFQNNKKR